MAIIHIMISATVRGYLLQTIFCFIYLGCNGSHIPCYEPESATTTSNACIHLRTCTKTMEEISAQIIYRSMKWSSCQLNVWLCDWLCIKRYSEALSGCMMCMWEYSRKIDTKFVLYFKVQWSFIPLVFFHFGCNKNQQIKCSL